MKLKQTYNEELETILMQLTDDELMEWFKTNELVCANPNLLEVIQLDLLESV